MTLKLNLLNYPKNIGTYEFLESVSSNNFTPQINLPTTITGTFSTKKDVKPLKESSQSFRVTILLEISKSVNWSVATQNNPNIGFENFMLIINNLLDKHANFKEQAKRKEKLRFKPWITKGILTSIK